MEITFLGHSCLRLRGREADVLIDPLGDGIKAPKLAPDIIVRTEGGSDPTLLRPGDGRAQVVSGPGEYELRGVRVTGITAGRLTVMRVEVDDVRVVVVGRLQNLLTEEAVDQLGHVDVLAVPVGGGDALNATDATRLVNLVGPAIVVPVRYRVDGLAGDFDPVDRFAKEMGLPEGWAAVPKLNLTGTSGPTDETRVVVLEVRLAT